MSSLEKTIDFFIMHTSKTTGDSVRSIDCDNFKIVVFSLFEFD